MNLPKIFRRSLLALSAIALVFVFTTPARALEMFLKWTPANSAPVVVGDSQDPVYHGSNGWFAVKSFSFSLENPSTLGGSSGGTAGRTVFNELALNKQLNISSVALFKALTSGAHYSTVQMVVRNAAAPAGQAFLIYDFGLVFVTQQEFNGATGDDQPGENLALIYGSLRITFKPLVNGTFGTPVIGTWNQVDNTPSF